MAKTEGVPGCIEDFSGAESLLVQVVKYKRKDVLIKRIDTSEEK